MFDLGLPALVFLGLCIWLVRKVLKAARTESDLDEERLRSALGVPDAPPPPRDQYRVPTIVEHPHSTDLGTQYSSPTNVVPEFRAIVEQLIAERELQLRAQGPARKVEVLWLHHNATHVAWCERRHAAVAGAAARDVICVAQVDRGKVVERWSYG